MSGVQQIEIGDADVQRCRFQARPAFALKRSGGMQLGFQVFEIHHLEIGGKPGIDILERQPLAVDRPGIGVHHGKLARERRGAAPAVHPELQLGLRQRGIDHRQV